METLSVKDVARRLSVTPMTINRWIRKGLFPGAYKLDPTGLRSPYRIPVDDVIAFEKLRQPNK